MIPIRSLSRAVLWNHLTKISGYGLDFVLSVVLARGLGNHLFGVYSELYNFIFLFSLFSIMGMDTSVNVFLPVFKNDSLQVSGFLKQTLVRLLSSSLLTCLAVIIARTYLGRLVQSEQLPSLLGVAAVFLLFYNLQVFWQAVLTSFYATRFLFFVNTLFKSMMIVVAVVVLNNRVDLYRLMLSFALIYFIVVLFYMLKIKRKVSCKSIKVDLAAFSRFGWKAWLINFVNYFLGRYSDILLMGILGVSKASIGCYHIAFMLSMALSYMFTAGLTGVMLTAFSEMHQSHSSDLLKKSWSTICKFMIFVCTPVFVFAQINARTMIPLLYSSDYQESIVLFQAFSSIYLISVVMGGGLNSTVLYAVRKENLILISRVILGLLNVGLNLILIPPYQALGAVIATGVSLVLTILVELVVLIRVVGVRFPAKFLSQILIAVGGAAAVSWKAVPAENGVQLIFHGVVFSIAAIVLLVWMKPFAKSEVDHLARMNAVVGKLVNLFSR